jgi:uncharacterized membrane protein YhaH (DUF805 family)
MTSVKDSTWPATASVPGNLTDTGTTPGPLDTIRRSFSFAGRSDLGELITYLFATLLVSVPVSFISGLTLERDIHVLIGNALTVLLAVPVPALLVRRFHDSGRSGAWVWLAIFGFAIWLLRTAISSIWGLGVRLGFDAWTSLIDWLVIVANLGSVLLALLPGTTGPNRYGADPRGRG